MKEDSYWNYLMAAALCSNRVCGGVPQTSRLEPRGFTLGLEQVEEIYDRGAASCSYRLVMD